MTHRTQSDDLVLAARGTPAICTSYGECSIADEGVTIERYPGPGRYCPECGEEITSLPIRVQVTKLEPWNDGASLTIDGEGEIVSHRPLRPEPPCALQLSVEQALQFWRHLFSRIGQF